MTPIVKQLNPMRFNVSETSFNLASVDFFMLARTSLCLGRSTVRVALTSNQDKLEFYDSHVTKNLDMSESNTKLMINMHFLLRRDPFFGCGYRS